MSMTTGNMVSFLHTDLNMKNNLVLKSSYYKTNLQPSVYSYKTNVTMMIPTPTALSLAALVRSLPKPDGSVDKIDVLGAKMFGLLNTDPEFLQKVLDFEL